MQLRTVKLVVADMDGTLLNSQHELPGNFYDVHQKLKERGILFAAASGRQYFNIYNKFPGLEEDILFIAENGSFVVYRGEELLTQSMDKDITRQQLREAKQMPDVYPILCGKKQAYVDNETPAFMEKLTLYYDKFKVVDDLLAVDDDDFLKIALCDLRGAEENSYAHFLTKKDILQVKVSGKIWLDLSDPRANKGRALKFVQEKFGISRDETLAFGDYLNDIEMIREAGISYAMENAHPDVKREATNITGSNDAGGVMSILTKLVSE